MQHALWKMYSSIQNALKVNKKVVYCPFHKFSYRVLSFFYKEGFINGYRLSPTKKGFLEISLKYNSGKPVIQNLLSPSKPGRRIYVSTKSLWKNQSSLNSSLVTSSKGLYSEKDCRRFRYGGENVVVLN
jgi:small subunit ribosomal protein S8